MEINMNSLEIKWILSYGKEAKGSIPIELRKAEIVPFICIFRSGEAVTFEDISHENLVL
jgi:hypothetical protein